MRKFFGKSSSKHKVPVNDELDQPVEIQIPVQDKVNLNVAFQQIPTSIENTAVMATEPTEEKSYYDGSSEIATETPLTLTRLETRRKLTKTSSRLVIVLVGLPARGKSFVARKLVAHMRWTGNYCEIFNVGRYRRQAYAEQQNEQNEKSTAADGACDANFFDPNNTQAAQLRERVAELALLDMLSWLDQEEEEDLNGSSHTESFSRQSNISASNRNVLQHGRVAIFDATNSTVARRNWILEMCTSPETRKDKPTGVVFVESVCDDKELIEENYRYKVTNSPDYENMSTEEALADLRKRVEKYESKYETIQNDSHSYIKIFNLSTKLLVNHIYGRMAKELVPALMAWHIGTRPIFLCRPGQTISGILTDGEDYVAQRRIDPSDPRFLDMSVTTKRRSLRGDTLGPNGKRFQAALLDFCYDEAHAFMYKRASVRDMAATGTSISGLTPLPGGVQSYQQDGIDLQTSYDTAASEEVLPFALKVMTSTMPRAVDTVSWEHYELPINQMSNLNPLDKGDYAGMELEDIRKENPAWYEKLEKDPWETRFPGGESYCDLIKRLTSVVIDMEQQVTPTLLVSHLSILQCLMAYFRNTPVERCMSIEVPMHTIIKFTPVRGGGWSETVIPLLNRPGVRPVESVSEMSQLTNPGAEAPIWSDGVIMSHPSLHRLGSSQS